MARLVPFPSLPFPPPTHTPAPCRHGPRPVLWFSLLTLNDSPLSPAPGNLQPGTCNRALSPHPLSILPLASCILSSRHLRLEVLW